MRNNKAMAVLRLSLTKLKLSKAQTRKSLLNSKLLVIQSLLAKD